MVRSNGGMQSGSRRIALVLDFKGAIIVGWMNSTSGAPDHRQHSL
jgi:hypothetical protein